MNERLVGLCVWTKKKRIAESMSKKLEILLTCDDEWEKAWVCWEKHDGVRNEPSRAGLDIFHDNFCDVKLEHFSW